MYKWNTTFSDNVRLTFKVETFEGITRECVFGGFVIFYSHLEAIPDLDAIHDVQYRHNESLRKGKLTRKDYTYEPYCAKAANSPLIGKINNLYLEKGETIITIYGIYPLFRIALTMISESTPCEGITNTNPLYCSRKENVYIITSLYYINCMFYPRIELTFTSATCVVLQHFYIENKKTIRGYFSVWITTITDGLMDIEITIAENNHKIYSNHLKEELVLDQDIIENRIIKFHWQYGSHNTSTKTRDVETAQLQYKTNFPDRFTKIYYQYVIYNRMDVTTCHILEHGTPLTNRSYSFEHYQRRLLH